MTKQIISTAKAPAAIGVYSQAARVGNTIWVSGQIPLDPATKELVSGDMESQVRQVFRNLQAIVEAAGAQLDDVVKATVYLHRSNSLRSGQQDHGRIFSRALPGARRRRRRGPAARCADRSGVRRRLVIDSKPVTVLRGVGDALAERLRALGVQTTQDLLFLLPLRYEDRTRVVPLGELRPGQRAAVEGEVLLTEVSFRGRRQMLCRIGDGSGFLTLRFFHFTAQQQSGLARGLRIRCFGEARRGPKGLEFVHPEYRRVERGAANAGDEHLTPIYPGTDGITQARLRQLVRMALDQTTADDLKDWLPASVLADSRLPALREALQYVHRPPADAPVELLLDWRHPAQRRLAFEELLAHQLSLKLLRQRIQRDPGWPLAAPRCAQSGAAGRAAVSPDARATAGAA